MSKIIDRIVGGFTLSNLLNLRELRNKLLFTLFAIFIYRLLAFTPIPGIDVAAISSKGLTFSSSWLATMNSLSGGAMSQASIASIYLMPYMQSSIAINVLCATRDEWKNLRKEGGTGRAIINKYTKYGALFFCLPQSIVMSLIALNMGAVLIDPYHFTLLAIVSCTTSTMFLVWLAEQINKLGIGEGTSVILAANILSDLPSWIVQTLTETRHNNVPLSRFLPFLLFAFLTLAFIVIIEASQRRIKIIYSRKSRLIDNASLNDMAIPIKLSASSIQPVIFAQLVSAALTASMSGIVFLLKYFQLPITFDVNNFVSSALHDLFLVILVMAFAIIWTPMAFSPLDTSDNLNKQGAFIPGYHPGAQTTAFLERVLFRLSIVCGIYLSIVSIAPPRINGNFFAPLSFAGTSILIVTNVIAEVISQIATFIVSSRCESMKNNTKNYRQILHSMKRPR